VSPRGSSAGLRSGTRCGARARRAPAFGDTLRGEYQAGPRGRLVGAGRAGVAAFVRVWARSSGSGRVRGLRRPLSPAQRPKCDSAGRVWGARPPGAAQLPKRRGAVRVRGLEPVGGAEIARPLDYKPGARSPMARRGRGGRRSIESRAWSPSP
jgi:hypothetical protein